MNRMGKREPDSGISGGAAYADRLDIASPAAYNSINSKMNPWR